MEAPVAIVVDPDFGERLADLSRRMPVWICDTPTNHAVAETSRRLIRPQPDITTFDFSASASPETTFLDVVADVDLHHGEYSKERPWTDLHVFGVTLTPTIQDALSGYGIHNFSSTPTGFFCTRGARGAV